MADLIIIGAGIMGSCLYRYLQKEIPEMDIVIVDDLRKESGTSCCGGAVKPSKLTGLSDEDNSTVLKVLAESFGLSPIRFEIRPTGGLVKVNTYLVNMEEVDRVKSQVVQKKVVRVLPGKPIKVILEDGEEIEGTHVIVATGAWVPEIFPQFENSIYSKKGITYIFPISSELKPQSFVKTWAPYKQITVHPLSRYGGEYLWTGDGTAIIDKNWKSDHSREALRRVRNALDTKVQPYNVFTGLRPFSKGKEKPCLVEEISENLWVLTGAGKFGAIAAGWAANAFLKMWVG